MLLSTMIDALDTHLARHRLRRCAAIGVEPHVRGNVWIHGDGEVRIGDRVFLDGTYAPIELHAWKGAVIEIGDDSYIGGGTSIEATRSIRLGPRVRLEAFCRVMDNHFHVLVGNRRARPDARPVMVEPDVEVGARAILLAGAHVGRGVRIAAGSVVARRRPPHTK